MSTPFLGNPVVGASEVLLGRFVEGNLMAQWVRLPFGPLALDNLSPNCFTFLIAIFHDTIL